LKIRILKIIQHAHQSQYRQVRSVEQWQLYTYHEEKKGE
jgi:hypothetical protein